MENLSYVEIILIGAAIYLATLFFDWAAKKRKESEKLKNGRQQVIESFFGKEGFFHAKKKFFTSNIKYSWVTGIAIDYEANRLCVFRISSAKKRDFYLSMNPAEKGRKYITTSTLDGLVFEVSVLPYSHILSSEIFEDGDSVTTAARGSQIGGAIVGGVLMGGAGAIIGGLSGKKHTSQNVRRIELRLTVNDADSPIHDVTFLGLETPKNSVMYEQSMLEARHWHGLAEFLIKKADAVERRKNSDPVSLASQGSVADEIRKLAELKGLALITEHEFEIHKKRLLNSFS
ncbi:hypothetical protein [Geopseudomonas aromaticivorans]